MPFDISSIAVFFSFLEFRASQILGFQSCKRLNMSFIRMLHFKYNQRNCCFSGLKHISFLRLPPETISIKNKVNLESSRIVTKVEIQIFSNAIVQYHIYCFFLVPEQYGCYILFQKIKDLRVLHKTCIYQIWNVFF